MGDEPSSSKNADMTSVESQTQCKVKRGGINCCVPQCTRNTDIKNPEEKFLQTRWVKLLKTKGLVKIGQNSRTCSTHFPGSKKTYLNNIYTNRVNY